MFFIYLFWVKNLKFVHKRSFFLYNLKYLKNSLIDSSETRGIVVYNMRRYVIRYPDPVFVWIYKHFSFLQFITEILCFWNLCDCYSATYGPILMKLCMIVKRNLTHDFTKFRKVLSFFFFYVLSFRFYRLLVCVCGFMLTFYFYKFYYKVPKI